MIEYKVAASLLTLRTQLDTRFPSRSHADDGFIGDASHQSRESDHNPWWLYGGMHYVTAGDFTHDPKGGLDADQLANSLVTAKDIRVKYVIRDGWIWDSRWSMSGNTRVAPWIPVRYTGPNPHKTHLHLSVLPIMASLSTDPWELPGLGKATLKGDDLPTVDEVWAEPVDDYYAKGKKMPVGAAVAWAAANAGWARDAAADAVRVAKVTQDQLAAISTKLDRLLAKP